MKSIVIEISRDEIAKCVAENLTRAILSTSDGTEDAEASACTITVDADFIDACVRSGVQQYVISALYKHDGTIKRQVAKVMETDGFIKPTWIAEAVEKYIKTDFSALLPKALKEKIKAAVVAQINKLSVKGE